MTTDDTGKKRRRKTTMEGFHNVPKILEEARRLVDAVTEPAPTGGPPTAATADQSEAAPAPPVKRRRAPVKVKPVQGPAASEGLGLTAAKAAGPGPAMKPPPLRSLLAPDAAGIWVIHRVPGRTRLKIQRLKWNPALAAILTERMALVPGVMGVEPSTVTGSVVVYYHPRELCQPTALQALREAWQELFPTVDPERLTAALIGQG